MTVEGVPNELYAQNMEIRHQYDEIMNHFGDGPLKEAGAIQKDLQLHNVNIASYYTDKYAFWLDFRTIDDNRLHSSGRRLENTSGARFKFWGWQGQRTSHVPPSLPPPLIFKPKFKFLSPYPPKNQI